MNLSNSIAQMIIDMLEDKSEIEIQRNILAQDLGCVPSQINYVLSSRFTPERGYQVESRRGGGGFIKITRISYNPDNLILEVIGSVGEEIDESKAKSHIMNLTYHDLITPLQARLILAAVSDSNFRQLHPGVRNIIRARIFKQMLLAIVKE